MIEADAHILKGTHHVPAYSLNLEWSPDKQKTDYEPVYDGLVLNEDNIKAVCQRIRVSLGQQEPVIVALFVPNHHNKVSVSVSPADESGKGRQPRHGS